MSSPPPPDRPSRWLVPVILVAAVLLLAAGAAAYFWFRRTPPPPQDLVGAMTANTRGVGQMERFDYAAAQKEFEEAARLAPDWLPARINLGIALFNQQPADTKELAAQVV